MQGVSEMHGTAIGVISMHKNSVNVHVCMHPWALYC